VAPVLGATRVVNPDVKTRVPSMMSVPLTDATNIPIGVLTGDAGELPFEVYYIKRPVPVFKWGQPLRPVGNTVQPPSSRLSTIAAAAPQTSAASETQLRG
jgi:hypothetical protein